MLAALMMVGAASVTMTSCGDDDDDDSPSGGGGKTSVAVTGKATEVTDRSATLTGSVNLEQITIFYSSIEYGVQLSTDADFTSPRTVVQARELVEGQFTVSVTGLSAETKYWFRTYVQVSDLTYLGQSRTFTTEKRSTADTHEYVDLGLPSGTLWATKNVGAENPEDYGDYFAWGETTGYTQDTSDGHSFDWTSYKYCNGSHDTLTKYNDSSSYGTVDNKTELELSDDAAYVNWGSNWRMPSYDQFVELINSSYTTTTWTTQNGVYGRKITSKTNGNSIFLPAAGFRFDTSLYSAGSHSYYWSHTLITGIPNGAHDLAFNSRNIVAYNFDRCGGLSVRPVRYVPASGITLNYETYTLTRLGKTVQLEATILPENAINKNVTWKSLNDAVCVVSDGLVVATGEGTTVVSATTEDGGYVAYCTITVSLVKCATPAIHYDKGRLSFTCETEGVEFVSDITDTDIKAYKEAEIDLSVTYTVRVHATHPEYYDSEEAVATLCWIEVDPKTEGIVTDVKEMSALPVLIQSSNGTLRITGAEDGTPISVYTTSGQLLGTTTVHGNVATLGTNLHHGIAVVRIGNRSVKVVVK